MAQILIKPQELGSIEVEDDGTIRLSVTEWAMGNVWLTWGHRSVQVKDIWDAHKKLEMIREGIKYVD